METLKCVLFFKIIVSGIEMERSRQSGFVLEIELKALANTCVVGVREEKLRAPHPPYEPGVN